MASQTTSKAKRSRLFLICVARSGSTALLKCLSFIDGVEAWFEPYIVAKFIKQMYKLKRGKELPTDWSEEHASDFDEAAKCFQVAFGLPHAEGRKIAFSEVKRSLDSLTVDRVIVKDIGNAFCHRVQYLPSPNSGFRYVFLIRDPQLSLASHRKASYGLAVTAGFDKPAEEFDLYVDDEYYYEAYGNYKNTYDAWQYVKANLDPDPLIIDSDDLMANPKPILQKICEIAGFEYHDCLLNWEATGDIMETWKNPASTQKLFTNLLSHFHQETASSPCFKYTKREKPPLSSEPKDVQRGVAEGQWCYNEMYRQRYKP